MILKKFTSIAAILVLLAACESAPTEKAAAGGEGAKSGASAPSASASSGPPPVALGSSRDFILNVGDRVFFDLDKATLKPKARAVLERQAAWFKRYPRHQVVVEGHCDERGTREYNLALGDRRANAIKDFLVALGVSSNRISSISYGKERPVALGHDEAAWSQNRRGVTMVKGRPGS
jgi:peptidoglycan-associated lipoprotein